MRCVACQCQQRACMHGASMPSAAEVLACNVPSFSAATSLYRQKAKTERCDRKTHSATLQSTEQIGRHAVMPQESLLPSSRHQSHYMHATMFNGLERPSRNPGH